MSGHLKQGKKKASGGLWRKFKRKKRHEDIAMTDLEGIFMNPVNMANNIMPSYLKNAHRSAN